MTKDNIIDIIHYRSRIHETAQQKANSLMSEELKMAIQNLIDQLREDGPIKKSG